MALRKRGSSLNHWAGVSRTKPGYTRLLSCCLISFKATAWARSILPLKRFAGRARVSAPPGSGVPGVRRAQSNCRACAQPRPPNPRHRVAGCLHLQVHRYRGWPAGCLPPASIRPSSRYIKPNSGQARQFAAQEFRRFRQLLHQQALQGATVLELGFGSGRETPLLTVPFSSTRAGYTVIDRPAMFCWVFPPPPQTPWPLPAAGFRGLRTAKAAWLASANRAVSSARSRPSPRTCPGRRPLPGSSSGGFPPAAPPRPTPHR